MQQANLILKREASTFINLDFFSSRKISFRSRSFVAKNFNDFKIISTRWTLNIFDILSPWNLLCDFFYRILNVRFKWQEIPTFCRFIVMHEIQWNVVKKGSWYSLKRSFWKGRFQSSKPREKNFSTLSEAFEFSPFSRTKVSWAFSFAAQGKTWNIFEAVAPHFEIRPTGFYTTFFFIKLQQFQLLYWSYLKLFNLILIFKNSSVLE